ncbi:MAG: HEAT repeat domain-containing protein, partial [Cystobacter sp.]
MPWKSRRAQVLSVASALLVVLGSAVVWKTRPVAEAPDAAPAKPGGPARAPAPSAALPSVPAPRSEAGRAWSQGLLYRYALTTRQKVAFGDARQPTGGAALPGMDLTLEGEWKVGVVAVEAERVHLRVNLEASAFELSVEGQDALSPEVRRAMGVSMAKPFFLTVEHTGRVAFTHFEENVDDLSRGILRTLVASSQFVVRGALSDTWHTDEETDTTGRYQATYQRRAPGRVEKTRQAYTHLTTPEGLEAMGPDVKVSVSARAMFELGEDLWTQTLQTAEHLEVDTGEGMPRVYNDTSVTLRLLARQWDASLKGAFEATLGMLDTAPLANYQGRPADPLKHHRQILGNRTFEDLMRALRALPEEKKAREYERTQVLEQLRALFMLKPEEALKVPDLLRSSGLAPDALSPMLGALSAASTPAAIQSLAKAGADASLSADVRLDAVSALGMAGEPTREGVDALRNLTRDPNPMLRDTASLAMGNAAYQMTDDDARGTQALLHELKNTYRSATTPEQQALALRALGNTRAPDALETLRDALRSNSMQVRQSAIEALRNIPGPEVDQLLTRTLLTDPAHQVRRAAVFACGFRPLAPLLPALSQALQKDTADGVRTDIVYLLGTLRASVPEATPLLQWVHQKDPHPEIRRMAGVYLQAPTTPSPLPPDPTPTR